MAQQSITLANYSDIQQLQSNMATIETTSTASKAYAVGEYLVYGGQLYIVTAAITLGDTLTVGTNIATTTIGSCKVNTTGDTMTGDIMIEKSDPRFYTKNPDIDMTEADNGVSTTVYNGMRVYDANGKDIGCLYSSVRTSGISRTGLWAYNYDTDGNLVGNNSMGVEVDKSGNLNYWVTNPVNFCSALGIGAYINVSGGTSGSFSVPSGTTTNLVSMAIPSKGTWVVWGQIAYQSGGNSNYRCAYIGTSSTGNQLAAAQVPATTANTGVQVMAITQITNTTTTLYLNALHAAGQNIDCPKTSVRFRAVKIAPV